MHSRCSRTPPSAIPAYRSGPGSAAPHWAQTSSSEKFASEPSEPSEPSEARKSYEFGIGRLPDSSGANRPIATSDRPAQNPANTVVSDGSDGSDGYIPDFSDDHGDAWEGP